MSKLWEAHTQHEFATRATAATLATMVEDAYVNHVPVITGCFSKSTLVISFYSRDFIPSMPPDVPPPTRASTQKVAADAKAASKIR